ncbi:ABC transporter permease [Caldibacillus debilis]|uniref:ABC-2 type transporter transmembrane domain-containing protein n=1 Tax=Caldibacillus debilis TaxID=301148 RepID=A0A150MBV0_9BACI|nr:ABC transporter permease [Caldibacillus debilis]KYD21931.1 hypothetical protein B4135_1557 [Caldibacillus debilis]
MGKVFKIFLVATLRDKLTMFWSVLFPIALLLILGQFIDSSRYHRQLLGTVTGMGILFLGLYTIGFEVLMNRKAGIYKLLRITPFRSWQLMIASCLSKTFFVLISSYLTILIGAFVFDVRVNLSGVLFLLPVLFLGTLGFMFLGFTIGNLARLEPQVNVLANLIGMPMLFISNGYYNISNGPVLFERLAKINPFEHFIRLINMFIRGDFSGIWSPLSVIVLFTILSIFPAVLTFRWDPEQPFRLNVR